MRIAVIGTGGVGGGFGAALAKAGGDVTFLARGAHLAAMREHGLRIAGDRGDTVIHPVQATDDPASIGPVDVVLFCVKLWDVETAGAAIKGMVGPETAVIPPAKRHRRRVPPVPDIGSQCAHGRHGRHQCHHRRPRSD